MTASERAAGELVADIDTLAAAVVRIMLANTDATPRKLAEALVAAGFGNVAAARREERERIARAIEAESLSSCGGCDSCDGNTRYALELAAHIARKATP